MRRLPHVRRSPWRRRQQPEAELQRAVVRWLVLRRPSCFWLAVPNGGARTRVEAAILQGLGVRAGVPDLLFLAPSGSGGIELKVGRGRQSPAQIEVQAEFRRLGLRYAVARDLPGVEAILAGWGFLPDPRRPDPRPVDCGEAGSCGAACRCVGVGGGEC